ncbi:COG3904 family protein [Qipengyuania sp. CAU 1752]
MFCIRRFIASLAGIFFGLASTSVAAAAIEAREFDGIIAIVVIGEIVAGDENKFRALSLRYDDAIVVLNSPGGALEPALAIGRAIRIREYPTAVTADAMCASSCALIWLAGSTRYLSTQGLVGFHASYYESNGQLIETGVGNALIGHYLSQLNLPENAVRFATSASPTTILWLDATNRAGSGIHYETLDPVSDGNGTTEDPAQHVSLNQVLSFENPAKCEMSPDTHNLFRSLVKIDEDDWSASQGRPVKIKGLEKPLIPTFSRNRESSDGYDVREVLATLPLKGKWLGLSVNEIQYWFFEESSRVEYRIFVSEKPTVALEKLNRVGFSLSKVAELKHIDPDDFPRFGMALLPDDKGGAVLVCGTSFYY